jgi:RNA polymerase sigma factor (sigma-70 family)
MPETNSQQVALNEDIRNAINGDEEAWVRLYRVYRPFLMSWVKSKELPTDLSYRDLVQDAWMKIYAGLSSFEGTDNDEELTAVFFAWVRRVATNTYTNKLVARSAKKRSPSQKIVDQNSSLIDADGQTPSAIVSIDEQKQLALEALQRLPGKLDRQILKMVIWEGHSLNALSGVLGIDQSTLRRRYNKALKQLKDDFRFFKDKSSNRESD